MGSPDVAFLPSRASFSTTFHEDCGIGESLRTTTCPKIVVGASKGMLPVRLRLWLGQARACFL